ncbi:MAG: helix-turn-helix transcriptional regulator [Candidatus Marinimicrobia bacterium]|nr:helix-turn-helix transcriptional regulator [Candidatus Neomarinimicrobiota bacterium]
MYNPVAYFDTSHWLNRIAPCLWAANNERNASGWQETRKCQRFQRLMLIRDGQASVTVRDRAYHCRPNEYLVLPAQTENHCLITGRKTAWRYWIDFDWNYLVPYDSDAKDDKPRPASATGLGRTRVTPAYVPQGVIAGSVQHPDLVFDHLDRMCFRWCTMQSLQQVSCRGIFLEVLILLLGQQFPVETRSDEKDATHAEDHLTGKIRYLLGNFARCPVNKRPSVEFALAELGHSYGYLSRVFRRDTGMTPLQYVNARRMEHAASLLRDTDLTFAEVGFRLGIDNPSYFSHMFKKYAGSNPREYRARTRCGGGTRKKKGE